jgi:hypothetical protein
VRRGPDAVAEKLLVRAAELAGEVSVLRLAAHELRTTPPTWPSRRQVDATIAKVEGIE